MAKLVAKNCDVTFDTTYKILSVYWDETRKLLWKGWSPDGDCDKITAAVRFPGIGRLFASAGVYKQKKKRRKKRNDDKD